MGPPLFNLWGFRMKYCYIVNYIQNEIQKTYKRACEDIPLCNPTLQNVRPDTAHPLACNGLNFVIRVDYEGFCQPLVDFFLKKITGAYAIGPSDCDGRPL